VLPSPEGAIRSIVIRRLSKLLHRSPAAPTALALPSVERELVAHLFDEPIHGLPRIDWGMADD
jgi:hypothetical protein